MGVSLQSGSPDSSPIESRLMPQFADIGHVIQLAIAPVFMLTAIGTVLNGLAGRLARAVDRRRLAVAALPKLEGDVAEVARREIAFEQRRIRLVYIAITMCVVSALLVCALISIAFIDAFIKADLAKFVAAFFILAMFV